MNISSEMILEFKLKMVAFRIIMAIEASDEGTRRTLLFLLDDWLHFLLNHHPHSLVEDCLKAFLSQGTAFHVFALELLFDDLSSCFSHNRGFLRVFFYDCVFISQIDLVADKYFRHASDVLLELRIPLRQIFSTFFLALTKDAGSMTEKTMRKTSQLG